MELRSMFSTDFRSFILILSIQTSFHPAGGGMPFHHAAIPGIGRAAAFNIFQASHSPLKRL
ncbi:hypothetical protein L21SP2_0516 [Salinispira pacifica]|uniref:Uncharacterized protein n=1 Tax=Salinispira pacifica TaxID=1307761 RepID=V5WDR4_9SPIO|nr:hypothetical protein L21SP2_0516 [Salinispira pacifica]